MRESMIIKPPAAPGNNETAVLFDSITMFGAPKQLRYLDASMLEVTFNSIDQDSAVSGLIFYSCTTGLTAGYTQNNLKDDNGVATLPVQVLSTDDPRTYRFVLTPFEDAKLTYTAGATGPTAFGLSIVLHFGATAVTR